jgi:RecB family exonuclease
MLCDRLSFNYALEAPSDARLPPRAGSDVSAGRRSSYSYTMEAAQGQAAKRRKQLANFAVISPAPSRLHRSSLQGSCPVCVATPALSWRPSTLLNWAPRLMGNSGAVAV